MIRYTSICLMLAALLLPALVYGSSGMMHIVYTGGLNGELEPCGCSSKTDFGGVARTAAYIEQSRAELSPFVMVDAGNFTGTDSAQGRLKAEAMLEAFHKMKYDAVAVMKNERSYPDDYLRSVLKEYEIPSVSNQPSYGRTLSVTRDGIRLNISTDQQQYLQDSLNVLLTDTSAADIQVPDEWDVVITSSGEDIEQPFRKNNTVITAASPGGKKLGILTLRLDEKGEVSGYSHRWAALGGDAAEDPEVRAVLDAYDAEVAELMEKAEKPLAGTTYLGVSGCADCHQLFVESWEKTAHAGAFESLRRAGKTNDPECIICHVVGFGEEGGFFSIDTTPGLAGVQCEACHGLDREHVNDFSRPMKQVTEKVCLKCHTEENSPDFDYPVYLEKIMH